VKATLFFQLMNFCIRPWPWILVGLAGFILYPEVMSGDKSREAYVYAMKDFLPSGYRGLLLVAFLAAYMSTISTQLNWGVSCLLNDGYHRFLKPQATEKQLLNAARVLTLISGIAGLIATLFVGSISGVWTFLMNCGAGVGLVLILRWYWWRVNALSEIVAILTPFIVQGGFVIIRIASDGTMVIPTPFDYLVCVLITCITSKTSQ
jgi:Na+/proline symporter